MLVNKERKNSMSMMSNKYVNDRNNYRKDNKNPSLIEKLLRTTANGDIPMVRRL